MDPDGLIGKRTMTRESGGGQCAGRWRWRGGRKQDVYDDERSPDPPRPRSNGHAVKEGEEEAVTLFG